jgi:hypothetical protein
MLCEARGRGDETIFFSDLLFSDYRRRFGIVLFIYIYILLIVYIMYARDPSLLPFRDDYRNSLTSHPSGSTNNEKTRVHMHTSAHETTRAGGCSSAVLSRTATPCMYTVVAAAAAIVTRGLFGTSL